MGAARYGLHRDMPTAHAVAGGRLAPDGGRNGAGGVGPEKHSEPLYCIRGAREAARLHRCGFFLAIGQLNIPHNPGII